jgi:subtilisin family serine protease
MIKNKVSVPTDFSYFDKYQDRKLEFNPKSDEMVASITPRSEAETIEESDAVIRAASVTDNLSGLSKLNLERGVAVIKVEPQSESLSVVRTGVPEDFTNAIPAFKDAEGLTRYFLPDEVTVQFNAEISDEQAEKFIGNFGSSIVIKQRTSGYYTIAVPEGRNIFETINVLNESPEVMFAETSEIGFDDAQAQMPNDPRFNELWGLENSGQTIEGEIGTPGADIKALKAWETTKGDPDVVIAVIDTGMDMTHEDLIGNLVPRNGEDWNFAMSDGSPDDSGSHGTHVCGTSAAVSGNGKGISGVAPGCRLMPLRINLSAGMNSNRADAINFASQKASNSQDQKYVINCSWRASGNFSAILLAIDTAISRGAIVVFAAGNASRDMDVDPPQYPGVYPNAICVAALDSSDKRAYFSNIGSQVDVSAPGVNILSSIPSSNYDFFNGTSMAAPHVAGVCALIWSVNKSLTNLQVRKILEDNCDDVSPANPLLNGKLGRGRVNAAKAVAAAGPPYTS